MANFPERLKVLRLTRNLTQKALGELTGLSKRGIQSYEIEERKPTIDKLEILANYFGVSTDYLLGCSEIPISLDKFLSKEQLNDFMSGKNIALTLEQATEINIKKNQLLSD